MKTKQKWSGRLARAAGVMLAGLALTQGSQVLAQATPRPPERMTYQGYLAGSDGVALGNTAPKNYEVIFRIFDSQSGTTPLWGEQQTVTVDKGNYSVLLGEGVAVPGVPFAGISLSSLFAGPTASDRYLGLTVKGIGSGGANVEILPRLRLLPAPYAYLSSGTGKLLQTTGADLVTSSGNQVTVAGDLKANALSATDATITGTLYPVNMRANTLVVTNITSVGTVVAGNVTAFGTLASPAVTAGSLTLSNNFSSSSIATSSGLTLKGLGALVGENSGLRILYGNTDDIGRTTYVNGVYYVRNGVGDYSIFFQTPFTAPPAVLVTPHGYGGFNVAISGLNASPGLLAQNAQGSSLGGFRVRIIMDQTGIFLPLDQGFDFIAIGK